MRKVLALLAIVAGLSAPAGAQTGPVLLELYTSQGCSSCPPADAMLKDFADRDDVVALALHVDYWDYLGWRDSFGDRKYTNRQRAYARAANHRTVYTPQIIIQGRDHVVGYKPADVAAILRAHQEQGAPMVFLDVKRNGDSIVIKLSAMEVEMPPADVQVVRYTPLERVRIDRGENAGATIDYANIVTAWDRVGTWNGRGIFNRQVRAPGSDPVVVVVQAEGAGPVLAVRRLR